MRGGGDGMTGIYHPSRRGPSGPRAEAPFRRSARAVRSGGSGQRLLDGLEVSVDLRVALPELLDALDGAHHRRVVPVAEGAPELGEAATEPLPAEVHRDVPRERDALVAVLAEQLRVRQPEVAAH